MRFDYTHGEKAKYMVGVYTWSTDDFYYFHEYKKAKGLYDSIRNKSHDKEIRISLWDTVKDIRKHYDILKGE